MALTEFNIVVRPLSDGGWIVSAPAISNSAGTGETVFEAIDKWQSKLLVDAANDFVRVKMKS